ncbi:MAG: hypothetical protein GEU92_11760 [Alphaproteobacteria bacterium]|nr:hypothetical protein [Alphaproteobacteria bacterium]
MPGKGSSDPTSSRREASLLDCPVLRHRASFFRSAASGALPAEPGTPASGPRTALRIPLTASLDSGPRARGCFVTRVFGGCRSRHVSDLSNSPAADMQRGTDHQGRPPKVAQSKRRRVMKKIMQTALSVGMMALAGAAFAQTSAPSPGGSSGDTTQQSPSGTAPGASGAGAPSGTMSSPPADVVGKDIKDAKGDDIGEIEKVEGDTVIVGVGGFLGLGQRKVALPWKELTMSGAGDDATITTSMTKDQLKTLPEYKESDAGSTTGGDRPSGSMR